MRIAQFLALLTVAELALTVACWVVTAAVWLVWAHRENA